MREIGWQQRLVAVLQDPKFKSHEWGKSDCCILAADACMAVSGKDPAAEYRGKYDSEIGAKRVLAKLSIAEALDAHFERVDLAFVQRGDVVQMDDDAAGVVWAGVVWSVDKEKGIGMTNKTVRTAWRVE